MFTVSHPGDRTGDSRRIPVSKFLRWRGEKRFAEKRCANALQEFFFFFSALEATTRKVPH